MPCHVPRFKEPSVIGTDIVEPTRVAFVCETLQSFLGLRGSQGNLNIRIAAGRRHNRQNGADAHGIQLRHTLDLR